MTSPSSPAFFGWLKRRYPFGSIVFLCINDYAWFWSAASSVTKSIRIMDCYIIWAFNQLWHTYIHTSLHTYIHACIHAYMRTCIHAYMHTCKHAYMHTCIYINTGIHIHTYIIYTYIQHTYLLTYIHTYIHIHADILTYIHRYRHTYIG